MSISIDYKNSSSAQEAFDKAREMITPELIEKYQVKAELDYIENSKQIVAKGKGFKLTLDCGDNSAKLGIELAFLLKPLKGKILSSVERKLTRIL